jgi:hypothetical protein
MLVPVHANGHHGKWAGSHLSAVPAQISKALGATLLLSGTATGSWSSQTSNGTTTYSLSGFGVISPLQTVSVTATITHSIARVFDAGTVFLSTPQNARVPGTLTLTSVSDQGSLADPTGEHFHYTMSGTGAFAGMTGSGTFELVLTQSSSNQGQFTLVFNPAPVSRV